MCKKCRRIERFRLSPSPSRNNMENTVVPCVAGLRTRYRPSEKAHTHQLFITPLCSSGTRLLSEPPLTRNKTRRPSGGIFHGASRKTLHRYKSFYRKINACRRTANRSRPLTQARQIFTCCCGMDITLPCPTTARTSTRTSISHFNSLNLQRPPYSMTLRPILRA